MTYECKMLVFRGWIESLYDVQDSLDDWQFNFVQSVDEQLAKKNWLSEKQQDVLERIYAEKTK